MLTLIDRLRSAAFTRFAEISDAEVCDLFDEAATALEIGVNAFISKDRPRTSDELLALRDEFLKITNTEPENA